MENRLLVKLAVFAIGILVGFFAVNQIARNPQSMGIWLNSTAATDVAVSLDPFITLFSSVISGVFCLVSLIVLIQKLLEDRRYKKKYGESRTPVVLKANKTVSR